MDGFSNLFLGVGMGMSVFLIVQHIGQMVLRYFGRDLLSKESDWEYRS